MIVCILYFKVNSCQFNGCKLINISLFCVANFPTELDLLDLTFFLFQSIFQLEQLISYKLDEATMNLLQVRLLPRQINRDLN